MFTLRRQCFGPRNRHRNILIVTVLQSCKFRGAGRGGPLGMGLTGMGLTGTWWSKDVTSLKFPRQNHTKPQIQTKRHTTGWDGRWSLTKILQGRK